MGISKELLGKKTIVVSASNIQLLFNVSLMEMVYNEIWVILNLKPAGNIHHDAVIMYCKTFVS